MFLAHDISSSHRRCRTLRRHSAIALRADERRYFVRRLTLSAEHEHHDPLGVRGVCRGPGGECRAHLAVFVYERKKWRPRFHGRCKDPRPTFGVTYDKALDIRVILPGGGQIADESRDCRVKTGRFSLQAQVSASF